VFTSLLSGNTIVLAAYLVQGHSTKALLGIFVTLVLQIYLSIQKILRAMTFIGSVTAGGKVAQRAISQIRKCILEMGGSYSCIVESFMKILLHTLL
jgi:succinate-semialdehyde dehydrogenase/glutarate-semialdehyde dehydrogenase/succinyl-CoA reductase